MRSLKFPKWLACGVAGLAFASAASAAAYDASTGYVTMLINELNDTVTPFNVTTENDWWSDGQPPHGTTNYYVASGQTLSTPKGATRDLVWQGGRLVSGGKIWLVSGTVITIPDLVCLGNRQSFYCAGNPGPLCGHLTVQGTASNPVVFYHNTAGQMVLDATMSGGADSVFQFNKSYRNTTVYVRGDWRDYNGTLLLTRDSPNSKQSAVTNGYCIETAAIAGKLKATSGATVDTKLVITNSVTVGALELDDGVELALGDDVSARVAPGCLTVTGDVTLKGKPRITVGSVNCAFNAGYSYPLFRFKDQEGQELTLDDFEIVVGSVRNDTFGTFKLKWEVDDSATLAGYRELRIVKEGPAGDLVWYNQTASSSKGYSPFAVGQDKDGNFFWKDEGTPEAGKSYAVTNKTAYMGGPDARSPCLFPGEELYFSGCSLLASTSTTPAGGFEAKCMYWDGVTVQIWGSQGNVDRAIHSTAPWFSFGGGRIHVPDGTVVKNTSYNSQGVKFASEIVGGGTFSLSVSTASSAAGRRAYNLFCAENTNFTGRICVTAAADYTDANGVKAPSDENCVSLFVTNGLSLGGLCPSFAYDALTLERYGLLRVETCDVELADGLNRGVFINDIGRMTVKAGLVLTVNRPVTVNGTFRKQGAGTLALGGELRFTDGAAETLPTEGMNIVRIEEGVVRLEAAAALDGAAVTFAEGTKLVLKESAADDELAAKGLVNVKGTCSGLASEAADGKIAVEIDCSARTPADEVAFGLVTVATEEAANALAAKLAVPLKLTMGGVPLRRTAVSVASSDGGTTWTVSAKYEKTGLVIMMR